MGHIQGADRNYKEEDNPVQLIEAFVNSLDLLEMGFRYSQPKATGRPPYNAFSRELGPYQLKLFLIS